MTLQTMIMPDATFKDDSPVNTVTRIKRILQAHGVQTEEKWTESGVPNCYSVRISVFGTVFGVNGKGVNKEFALASGYGELMERLQLGKLFTAEDQKNVDLYDVNIGNTHLSSEELLSRNVQWYDAFCTKVKQLTGVVISKEELLEQFCDKNGNTLVTSFYCANKKTVEYLPTSLVNVIYATNGCAAGNTMEEALVQALSEIVERHFSERVLAERIAVPDIPEEVLQSCPIAYEIITYLRQNDFRVIVKDCSLGTKFPVVCVCLIDQKTGKYHTHFGAYPNFEIALQRTLTETFQGRNIKQVTKIENFFLSRPETFDVGNLLRQVVKGSSERHPDFFVASAEPYHRNCGFSGKNNCELLKECVDFFAEQGYDILVRDYSCLGFPTYQVIIPGYSEVYAYRFDRKQDTMRYYRLAQKVLRDPSVATIEEIMAFLMNMTQIAKRGMGQRRFSTQANIPANLDSTEEQYIWYATVANLNYTLGRNVETVKYIDRMLATGIDKDTEKLLCIKRYLTLCSAGYSNDQMHKVLECLHQLDTVKELFKNVAEKRNLMDSFVLHCDQQCKSVCKFYKICKKKHTDDLAQLIRTKQSEMNHSLVGKQIAKILQNDN